MNRLFTFFLIYLFTYSLIAQVGIGTTSPKGILDINSTTQGILTPRMTVAQANAIADKDVGELVFVTNTDATFTDIGFYFWDGSVWQPLGGSSENLFNTDGTLTGNRTVSQGNNNLIFDGTDNSLVVHGQNSNVGIGTSSPNAAAALDISSSNKGILIPRVSLNGNNDITTISNPQIGLMVYNTNNVTTEATQLPQGFVYYDGAIWRQIQHPQEGKSPTKSTDFVGRDFFVTSGNTKGLAIGNSNAANAITYNNAYFTLNSNIICDRVDFRDLSVIDISGLNNPRLLLFENSLNTQEYKGKVITVMNRTNFSIPVVVFKLHMKALLEHQAFFLLDPMEL
ncbi:MAG: hypothetical protein N4A45_07520 [Flavobacteriales bacterium]|jgi:hypothetical protein|nr:hypothetical protein [Flavobacteriales bacterium]